MKSRGLVVALAFLFALGATAAIFLYIRGVRDEARTGGTLVPVIVSDQDIPAGTDLNAAINAGAFVTASVPESTLVRGAVTSLDQLRNRTSSAAILAGEQIPSARLSGSGALPGGKLGIPKGFTAVTVALDSPQGLADHAVQGDHVTVYGTFDSPELTAVLVPDVEVLDVQRTTSAETAEQTILVTMALRASDASEVVFAKEHGSVYLALLPPGEAGTDQAPTDVSRVTR